MLQERRPAVRLTITVVTILILASAFYQRAAYNLRRIDYRNSNFVFFWLAGRMITSGENPYNSAQWLAQHDANHVSWRPDRIFLYPLPLAFLLAPLGFLELDRAYFGWQLLSQALMSLAVWLLLKQTTDARRQTLLLPLSLIFLFFGPVYLSLQIGSLGALTLAVLTATILALDRQHTLLAGILLSLTLLKPPQGLPIVALAAAWLVTRRAWPAIIGLGFGALALFFTGLLGDAQWLSKFAASGQAVMDRNMGVQSNAFGLAHRACAGGAACMWLLGGSAAILILILCTVYLWRRRRDLSPWEAFNIILPCAFVSTPYLWSYDQMPYIIPVVWIVLRLADRTSSYIPAFAFAAILVITSFVALAFQANTRSDMWSLLTTALVLVAALVLGHLKGPRASAPMPL